ncbi:MAG TPA: type II CRISPR-associated endonuclease Cas1 [Roseiarcus sp.]
MLRKTIEIATPGTRLSVAHRQLVIERPDTKPATVPIEDVGVLIVDDRRATYTQLVFVELLAAGATVVVTGPDHLPAGMMLPIDAHHIQTERHRAQVDASEPARKQIWRALVAAKLAQQGAALDWFGVTPNGLAEMAKRVRSGDPDNLEAHGAQRYWPLLFGKEFRRDRAAEGINALLNYGYAVVRAATARAVVASGLIPSLGVFHKNRANPFCLADDLFEPYRPFVDWRVKRMTIERAGPPSLNERSTRATLLSLFNETIVVAGRKWPLLLAIETSASSLARTLTGEERKLALPEGMPVAPEAAPDDEDA